MNEYQFIVAIATLLVTNGLTLAKMVVDKRKAKELIDKKQTEEIGELHKKIETISEENRQLREMITEFINMYNFKYMLKNAIELKADSIVNSNPDLDTNIKTLLYSGREQTIKFAKHVFFSKIEVSPEQLQDESSLIFDNLKMLCMTYLTEVRYMKRGKDKVEMTFARFMRDETNLKNISYTLISNIIDFKNGVYNGHSNEKFIEIFTKFIEKAFQEGIIAYRKFIKLELV